MKIGSISVWFGHMLYFNSRVLPRLDWFDGGSYWKFSIRWLRYLLEFSGPKKDKTVYKEVTSEELDKILKDIK